MAPKTYSKDRKKKLCRGPLHREGVMLPLKWFAAVKSGLNKGKLLSQCRACRRVYMVRTPLNTLVKPEEYQPVIDFLLERLSKNEACHRAGLYKSFLSARRETMRFTSFLKLQALADKLKSGNAPVSFPRSDPLVVPSEPLGEILRKFVDNWYKEHDGAPYELGRYGPLAYLADKSGVDRKYVYNCVNSRLKFVGLRTADALLQALNMPELLATGEIPVLKSPMWSQKGYELYMASQ